MPLNLGLESPAQFVCAEEISEWCSEIQDDATPSSAQDSPMPPTFAAAQDLLASPPQWEELKQPMVELLLKYYNCEEGNLDLIDTIGAVLEVLIKWQQFGIINAQSLLNFMIDQVVLIMGEVKNKLIMKAIEKYDLLNSHMKSDNEGAPNGPMQAASTQQDPDASHINIEAPGGASLPEH